MRARLDSILGTAQIRYQDGHGKTIDLARSGDDPGRVGHLRQHARRHERSDLDFAETGSRLGFDPGYFDGRRQHRTDALQAIAWPDLANENVRVSHLNFLEKQYLAGKMNKDI